jgi:hypothetical protein
VGRRPRWEFTADAATIGSGRGQVSGQLVVRQPVPVEWQATFALRTDGAYDAEARATIDRLEAGISAPRLLVGRKVAVQLRLVFIPIS